MDTSILPKNFEYASPTQLRFFKTATIREICESYNKYKTQRDNSKLKKSIDSTRALLDILENKGYVYSFIDAASSWLSFDVIDINMKEQLTPALTHQAEVITTPIVVAKKDEPPELTDFTSIQVATMDESYENIEPGLKYSNPLLWDLKVAIKYTNTLKSAVKRQLDFNLDLTDIEDLISQRRCFYTGVEFDNNYILTFDRVDRTEGYIKGNVVACTTQANALKNSLFELTNGVFNDITSLKRFVDIVYLGMSKSNDPLKDLLLFK